MNVYDKHLIEHLEMAVGVVDALHDVANSPAWNTVHDRLVARGLNYASIISVQAVLKYEIRRLKSEGA